MNKRRNGARSMAERNGAIDFNRRGFLRAVFVSMAEPLMNKRRNGARSTAEQGEAIDEQAQERREVNGGEKRSH